MEGDSRGVSTFLWGGHSGSTGEFHPIPTSMSQVLAEAGHLGQGGTATGSLWGDFSKGGA